MKTVGIILREWVAEFRSIPLYGIKADVVECLKNYDVNVICIPVRFNNNDELKKVENVIDFCDGIIFPGGEGINSIDCEIMRYVYEKNKPTLGICLGMQIMGKTFEGNVIENGAGKVHDVPYHEYAHKIKIDKNSKLYEIMGNDEIEVNSRHTDCVEYTKLDCVAKSENLIEAIEDKSKKFFIGVQWHPESIIEDKYSKKLFDYFIEKL